MKNLYIFTSRSPEFGGGVEKVSWEIGYGLSKTGNYNVHFVFPGEKNEIKNINGVNYVPIKTLTKAPFVRDIIFSIKLINFFRRMGKNDIVINNDFSPYFYLLIYKKKFKLIHICHGTMYGTFITIKKRGFSFFRKLLYILYVLGNNFLVKYVMKRADLVISLSKYLKEELKKYYHINPNKIEIIYNGCDININKVISHSKDSPLKILFTGSDYGRKGLNVLEGVAKEMQKEDILFNLIGIDSYKSKSINIKSLGKLKREEVYKIMAESDVIFLPSYYEGQPLVLLEGMSFGCIPVCSVHCHMDMLENTKLENFISTKNCVDDYVKIFKDILISNNINELRKLAKDTVSQYIRDNQVKHYINLIDKL